MNDPLAEFAEWTIAVNAAMVSDFSTGGNRVEHLLERYADERLNRLERVLDIQEGDGGDSDQQPVSEHPENETGPIATPGAEP